jgi:hypothetical protein
MGWLALIEPDAVFRYCRLERAGDPDTFLYLPGLTTMVSPEDDSSTAACLGEAANLRCSHREVHVEIGAEGR